MRKIGKWQVALRVLCALVLLSVGFAHKAATFPALEAASGSVDLAAYSLPDGSLAPLCQPGPGDGGEGKASTGSGCEACRIAAAILLPLRSGVIGAAAYYRVVAFRPPLTETIPLQAFPPNAAPRAPPAVLSIA